MARDFKTLAGLTLLIADDEERICALYRLMITRYVPDAVVILAQDGAEVVARALAHHPDAIVMDLAKPVLDGLAATMCIKADAKTADIPVIAVSGRVWDTQQVMNAGCDAFLTKPCGPEQLLATIAEVIDKRGGLRPRLET
jgi:two-component system cell cycle response regulator DivK